MRDGKIDNFVHNYFTQFLILPDLSPAPRSSQRKATKSTRNGNLPSFTPKPPAEPSKLLKQTMKKKLTKEIQSLKSVAGKVSIIQHFLKIIYKFIVGIEFLVLCSILLM